MSSKVENLKIIDQLIVGRVDPNIYAFSTNTVPNFLKVGDTYRPVSTRIQEWRRFFPDLEKVFQGKATVSDDVYFRDFAVHDFLENDLGKSRLKPTQIPEGVYYSREFFAQTNKEDVENAIENITSSFKANTGRYDFYDASERLLTEFHYERGDAWAPRPNQQAAIDRFVEAVKNGRSNLLMYAVMRFGKSFTSLCCAKAIDAKTVVVVSAKADVKSEWKKTVELAGNFEKHVFLDSESLLRSPEAIKETHAAGECAVVYLTLQDLQGPGIKEKHKEVFENEADLLIVDETHFGARASEYGRVLQDVGQTKDDSEALKRGGDDHVDTDIADEQIKSINAKTRLHLSGTPYRILMGSEFNNEDIIAFVQFSDVVQEKEEWDINHLAKDAANEWDNPYFGFPQLVRFAFNTNQSSIKKMEELRKNGATFTLSALMEPKSIKLDKENAHHKYFKHEAEILDLLKVIDGSAEDENILSFLDYDRIKHGKMCRHLVMVLPYCASCDAMQKLIETNRETFKNLGDYNLINISGVEGASSYKNPEQVKETIAKFENADKKTLTLTVNRMLTGSTVEQWDTMLYLKDTSSPQEYDQAIFRLQNQFTRELKNEDGDKTIKENLKPQTLLVDFDPMRLFRMQEQKSLIYNVNADDSGNAKLADRLTEELRISPIITMNHSKIGRVEAADILDAISEYNSQRSISDEAREVPVDLGLLESEAIRRVIEAQAELGSRAGLTVSPFEREGEEIDVPDEGESGGGSEDSEQANSEVTPITDEDMQSLEKKLQTYYQRILFFAMLTPEHVRSLSEIVTAIGEEGNQRIAENLNLDVYILDQMLKAFDPFKLNSLDYKIQNISNLARDESLTPIERASRALNKFSRISSSEVRTPLWFCKEIVNRIPGEELRALIERGESLLDLASKSGEFALALYDRLTNELGLDAQIVSNRIYSIPTSTIAYEFTRFFYEILGLETDNISAGFVSYDLVAETTLSGKKIPEIVADTRLYGISVDEIGVLCDTQPKGSEILKFGAIVGNPPYQESDGGAQASARPIYQKFLQLAKELDPEFMTFVVPTRWYLGGKGLDKFREEMISDPKMRELHDYLAPEAVFPGTNNRGGICHFLRDTGYNAGDHGTRIVTHNGDSILSDTHRPMNTFGRGVFLRDSIGVSIVGKIIETEGYEPFSDYVSPRKPFGLEGNIIKSELFFDTSESIEDAVICYGKAKKVGYVERSIVRSNQEWISDWKVLTPYANNIGTELNDDNQNAFVAAPDSVCSETFLYMGVGLELDESSAANLAKYLKTKFARFLHAQAKISQHGTKATYQFVPVLELGRGAPIDWGADSDSIDEQLFELFDLEDDERAHIRNSIKSM